MDAEHPLHDRLAAFASSEVRHSPMCGAHPVLDDGPCTCAGGCLQRVVAAVIGVHRPQPSRSINSLACEVHHPLKNRRPDLDEVDRCPACVVTPIVVCSCWNCSDYPCPTVYAAAEALTLTTEV